MKTMMKTASENSMAKNANDNFTSHYSRRVLVVFAIILFISACFTIGYIDRHTFSARKWRERKETRKYMVADLIKKHPLVGISEQDVIAILGAEDGIRQATFKGDYSYYPPESTLVYYIGHDLLEGEWLILVLKDGVVEKVVFGIT